MAFRPDGRLLVAGLVPELLDPASGARRPRPEGLGSLSYPYAFSPDGRLAAFSGTGRISLRDSALTSPAGELPSAGDSVSLAWSPDGRTLASYEFGDRIRLWDVPSRRLLGVVFDGLTTYGFGENASMAFSADGGTLYSATPEGVVRRHPLDGARAAAAVCARAGRTVTADEWERYLSDVPRFEVCG